MKKGSLVFAVLLFGGFVRADIKPVPFKTPDKLADALTVVTPMQARLGGYLGSRVTANEQARLRVVNEEELLAGFRKRPGKQAWIGEHVGKFLHAATLAWANTGDEELKQKIDRVAAELIKCQDADGYLGTYLPKDHWTSWDVWVHKYNLLGLLTYHQYTGSAAALDACRKMGDLLIATFPGKMSIIKAGTHVGMAATSVLEPIVLLYRITGEQKYLDFAKYIVTAYDDPNGPKVVKSLVEIKKVNQTANGKAYEMMSNLVGLCELARATGDKTLLVPAINAWEDVVAHQLYITGASSHGEHFGKDNELPNQPRANIGETCVTTTWIQLNAQLLRLTGEARYGDELERSYYNHLAGAQLPDGSKWCYYTPMMGTKPYGNSTNCCLSSGPRAMALAPQLACLKYQAGQAEGIAIVSLDQFSATQQMGDQAVTVEQKHGPTEFPKSTLEVTLKMQAPATFALKLRSPSWAAPMKAVIESDKAELAGPKGGWIEIPARRWKSGDRVVVTLTVNARVIQGEQSNKGLAALVVGPLVFAYDAAQNKDLPAPGAVALVEGLDGAPVEIKMLPQPFAVQARVRTANDGPPVWATFVAFSEAGAQGSKFQVWMNTVVKPPTTSLLGGGKEERSRAGNLDASINDGDPDTVVVTSDGTKKDEDFYAIAVPAPVTINKVVFMHGKNFHDGGWFDVSAGKPAIQVKREKDGPWQTVGALESYPSTTATNSAGIKAGQEFVFKMREAVAVFGVRITGKPACGDNPRQAFSSCGELQAYKE